MFEGTVSLLNTYFLLDRQINYHLLYHRVTITPQIGVLLQKRANIQVRHLRKFY
jgi:hypothetical protein